MVETYSIGITGAPVDNPKVFASPTLNSVDIPDSAATQGSREMAMRLNTPILCRNPDGSQSYYTYDAERNIPGLVNYLKKVT